MNMRTDAPTPIFVLAFTLILLVPIGQRVHAQDCPALADLRIEDTNLLSAAVVPASGDLPAYCRVLGYVRPAINFEIRLPTSGWNGKFYMAGCWGLCGTLDAAPDVLAINQGLKRNYAVSTMDGGHWGADLFDARWAYHDRQAEIDWGYRAVHETARVTKTIIEAFYGQRPEQSYFGGCSGGGGEAHMEAWRYPDDFDGIISGAPVLNYTGAVMEYAWVTGANTGPDGKNLITTSEAGLVEEAVYDACDSLDGLEDGLISDPRACTFDPSALACSGDETDSCLTMNQVGALQKMYDGPRDSAGQKLFPGVPLGSEPYWGFWITGQTPDLNDDLPRRAGTQLLRYTAFREDPGEQYSVADFNFDRDPQRMEFMARIYNWDNPDLQAYRESGGKLLMWQGWADPSVAAPTVTVDYYEAVEERVGSREATQDFLRLFMIPGMDHCGIGEGPGITQHGFDPLTTLERWVEEGEAPESLLTTKTDSTGTVQWTRPVCPYPQRAVYDGEGNPDEAANFECVNP